MSSSSSQVGYLVPLNQNLEDEKEEKASIPKLPISKGTNILGRNNLTVSDKRLSRKHLTITASTDGSANLLVEGTNPIVVNSKNKRRKLNSKETITISDGDVIELIPGHHLFKYQVLRRSSSVADNGAHERRRNAVTQKHDKIAVTEKHGYLQSSEEAIRDFHVADDQIPRTFRLLRVQGLPPWANTSCVSISDVIQGDILVAILSNYMVDTDWLVPACPALSKVPSVLVLHGESDERVACIKWPEFPVNLPSLGNFSICPSFFKKFDYSDATVRLIASVPGYHSGNGLKKWGHMKLRSVLQECTFDKEFKKSPLVYQFSSLGSLDEKWMVELASSMSAGLSEDKVPLGMGEPQIIWPTVEDVRCSLEGYAAGNAIPSPMKNVEKAFLRKYWAKWKANHTGRTRAMPHIKTFARYNNQNLAWFLLTSANLSKAAWGALQKNNSQLMIRSYELGVLFLSSLSKRGCEFSCTSNVKLSKDKCSAQETSEMKKTKLVTLTGLTRDTTHSSSEVIIQLPVPYELPPLPYSSEDVPWCWDRRYSKKDVYGQLGPRIT
ncbi:tyrosyl-DNA phosphodiesterase 1 isoform X2 [Cicer arietinum]|uniref:tyrosyl-DNA phosphodiesterase 1 isoform X2 n=1 Tax=Cicer arietinum TaxID=3827 RepID=UPI003CC65CB0